MPKEIVWCLLSAVFLRKALHVNNFMLFDFSTMPSPVKNLLAVSYILVQPCETIREYKMSKCQEKKSAGFFGNYSIKKFSESFFSWKFCVIWRVFEWLEECNIRSNSMKQSENHREQWIDFSVFKCNFAGSLAKNSRAKLILRINHHLLIRSDFCVCFLAS